ncbi:MAG: DNA repair and recombination protein RadB [Thermoplasmata archaeon]|nr:DNA repair and recombination protein RadB [Thermoplasmata archaeon]
MPTDHLPTGLPALDELLGGGLDTDSVTEVYGEGGTGKTILCLQVALAVAVSGRWVVYIDTEGVSVDKLEAMAGPRMSQLLEHLLISSPGTFAEQSRAVNMATRLARDGSRPVGLIIVDSATMHYRLELGGKNEETARRELGLELAQLVSAALQVPVPVLVTNQVWRKVGDGTLEPVGGAFLSHAAKAILRFDRLQGEWRRAVLMKHRSRPEGSIEFRISDLGLV